MPRDLPLSPAASAAPPALPPAAETGCLPRGFRLRDFVIEQVLAEGGFGVVYSAIDIRLQRRVAIKEYMPAALAHRTGDLSVRPRSSAPMQDAFAVGLKSFINEARLLAGFDHPSLVRVLQFWEDKGTGFMVMPLHRAPTLRQWALAQRSLPSTEQVVTIAHRIVQALALVHESACLHRDIAPDNVLLLDDGQPLLLDFGAARRVLEELTQNLTVIVKPGYAPIEQYAQGGGLKQGPWTDLYGLCATLHFLLLRRPPPAAIARMAGETCEPLSQSLAGRYPLPLLAAIDAGLGLRPTDRPSIAEFVAMLDDALAIEAAGVTRAVGLIRPATVEACVATIGTGTVGRTATAAPTAVEPGSTVDAPARSTATATATAAARRVARPRLALTAIAFTLAALFGASQFNGSVDSVAQPELFNGGVPVPVVTAAAGAPAPVSSSSIAASSGAATAPVVVGDVHVHGTPGAPSTSAVVSAPGSSPAASSPRSQAAAPAAMPAAPSRAAAATPASITSLTAGAPAGAASDPAPSAPRIAELTRLRQQSAAPESLTKAAATRASTAAPSVSASAPAAAAASLAAPQTPVAATAAPAPVTVAPSVVVHTPQPLARPQPAFPAEALREGIGRGRVVARLQVRADGQVAEVAILQAVPRRVFDRAVIAAARQWRYAPAAQPAQIDVEFVFDREG